MRGEKPQISPNKSQISPNFASNRNILSAITRDVEGKYKIENNIVHQ